MVVLGLDPGIRHTGFGIITGDRQSLTLVDSGVISPNPKEDISQKISYIYNEVVSIIKKYSPEEAAIEDVFMSVNIRSALTLGHARGAAMVACTNNNISIHTYEPTLVKKTIVGRGRADKSQVAFMVGQILGEKPVWPKDASDAIAIAICHHLIRTTLKKYK
ncbi:crossover junction endodeoxyribonuclease RuvC [Desulfothermus okinawensis JCM 13304]